MPKILQFDHAARESLKFGVDTVADAVKATLGPLGRNVVIGKQWGAPTITNDGVTVAREVECDDPYADLGAQLVKEVATRTNDVAGDGTTTATVLAQAMVAEGLRAVTAGANPMGMKRGIEAAVLAVVERLREASTEVDGSKDIADVATISAQDATIGTLIAEAMEQVGKDGVITVEEGTTMGTELEVTEGLQFDKGYISPYFVTDAERMEAVLDDRARPAPPGQDLGDLGPASPPREGRAGWEAAAARGRGRGRRGPFHSRGEQDPRRVERRGGQGAGVRRPPQGNARGRGRAHGRSGGCRRGRAHARPGRSRGARQRSPGGGHQGHHHRGRWRRQPGGGGRPSGSAASRDRRHRVRLGPREASGATREDRRWRRRDLGRRGHRSRAERAQAPHRGRGVRHQGGGRGRHCGRRGQLPSRPRRVSSTAISDAPATRRSAFAWWLPRSSSRCAGSPRTPVTSAVSWSRPRGSCPRAKVSTRPPASTATCVAAGIIDPLKVTRSALENAASIAALLLTTEALVVERPENAEGAAAAGHGHSHGPGGHRH